jgi:hypothetical protein
MERVLRLLDEIDSIVIAIRLAAAGSAGRLAMQSLAGLAAVVALALSPVVQLTCMAMAVTFCGAELAHRLLSRWRQAMSVTA